MLTLLTLVLLAWTGFVAWWNAAQAGKCWLETKALGGFIRVVVWSAVIQSAIGFSLILLWLLASLAQAFHWLPPSAIQLMSQLYYVLIIVPLLGTGLVITIHSWVVAYRERSIANMGVAAYNTLAMGVNMYDAATTLPSAFSALGQLTGEDKDGDSDTNNLVILLVLVSLAGGVLATWALVRHYAGLSRPLPALRAA